MNELETVLNASSEPPSTPLPVCISSDSPELAVLSCQHQKIANDRDFIVWNDGSLTIYDISDPTEQSAMQLSANEVRALRNLLNQANFRATLGLAS